MQNLRWTAVLTFALSVMLMNLDRSLLAAVQPSVLAHFGLDSAKYGELVAAFSITYGLSAPVMGWMLDRFGLTRVATIAIALWSLASVMTGYAGSFTELLVWRALLGFAESAAIPASNKAYAFLLPPRERSFGTAVNQIGLTVGGVGANFLAGWVPHWQTTFLIAGPLGWLWIPLWLAMSSRVNLGLKNPAAASTPKASSSLEILKDPKLWALAGAIVLTMPLYSLWANWTIAYLVRERHLTQTDANLHYAWIPQILATLGGLFGGWAAYHLAPKYGVQASRYRVCLLATAGVLLFTVAIPYFPSPLLATLAIGMSYFFTLAISVNTYAMPLDLYGPERAGFAISMLTCVYGLMQFAISPEIGRVIDRYGFKPIFWIGAVCPILGVLILWSQRLHRDANAQIHA